MTIRSTALLVAFIGAAAVCIASQAWYTITGATGGPGRYLNEHAIEVGMCQAIECVSTKFTRTTRNAILLTPESQ